MKDRDSKNLGDLYSNIADRRIVEEAEKYNITPLQVLYNRYGKEKADQLIAANREYTQQTKGSPLSKATSGRYNIPDYSHKRLNTKIPVAFKDLKSPGLGAQAKLRLLGKPSIDVNTGQDPSVNTSGYIRQELQTNKAPGTTYSNTHGNFISDNLGHETTHTLQKITGGYDKTYTGKGLKTNDISGYAGSKHELPAFINTMKYWYYENTGKLLPANMSDKDINDFINYWNANKSYYEKDFTQKAYNAVIEALKTPEGREVFRKTVYNPNKQTTSNIA